MTEAPTIEGDDNMKDERQNTGPGPTANVSCGCTGGASWAFMAIAAGLLGLYVITAMLLP